MKVHRNIILCKTYLFISFIAIALSACGKGDASNEGSRIHPGAQPNTSSSLPSPTPEEVLHSLQTESFPRLDETPQAMREEDQATREEDRRDLERSQALEVRLNALVPTPTPPEEVLHFLQAESFPRFDETSQAMREEDRAMREEDQATREEDRRDLERGQALEERLNALVPNVEAIQIPTHFDSVRQMPLEERRQNALRSQNGFVLNQRRQDLLRRIEASNLRFERDLDHKEEQIHRFEEEIAQLERDAQANLQQIEANIVSLIMRLEPRYIAARARLGRLRSDSRLENHPTFAGRIQLLEGSTNNVGSEANLIWLEGELQHFEQLLQERAFFEAL